MKRKPGSKPPSGTARVVAAERALKAAHPGCRIVRYSASGYGPLTQRAACGVVQGGDRMHISAMNGTRFLDKHIVEGVVE